MKEITAYLCEHCEKKIYRHKSSIQGHEKQCNWNPDNRACASCDNQDDKRFCLATGANLNIKTELRRNCDSWSQKTIF
jgi:hypothetical protein